MSKKIALIVVVLASVGAVGLLAWLLQGADVAVLNPQGSIASQQRDLIIFTLLLSSIVVIPVFILTFVIAWKYRATNHKANYRPDWQSNKIIETIWWGIPCAIILVLAVVTWQTSHSLDPYKPLDSKVKPIEVQVVALQWKWLFIYPEQQIASVNMVQFPEKTPVNFTITADAPMNSFWIPSLGGQVYAMSGMSTKLHLIADETGSYAGKSANISGEGFASMNFIAKSVAKAEFDSWVQASKSSARPMDIKTYNELAKPGKVKQPIYYSLKDDDLYDTIVMKYMGHAHESSTSEPVTPREQKTEDHHMNHDASMPDMEGTE